MIRGVSIIFLFYALGELVSYLLAGMIPGSVCGMILLWAGLSIGWIKPEYIKSVATTLTKNMGLFFVPAAVGIMTMGDLILDNWLVLALVSVITTLLVLIVVALTMEFMTQKRSNHD